MNPITVGALPEAISNVIKDQVSTAHARKIFVTANALDTLMAVTVLLGKENCCMLFIFAKQPRVEGETEVPGVWTLLVSRVIPVEQHNNFSFRGDNLLLSSEPFINFINNNGVWKPLNPELEKETVMPDNQDNMNDLPPAVQLIVKKHMASDAPSDYITMFDTNSSSGSYLIAVKLSKYDLRTHSLLLVFAAKPGHQSVNEKEWFLVDTVSIPFSPLTPLGFNTIGICDNGATVAELRYTNNAWTVTPVRIDSVKPQSEFRLPTAFRAPATKLIVKSGQMPQEIINVAAMLGLTLVYQEDNKLVFNKESLSPFQVPSLQPHQSMTPRFSGYHVNPNHQYTPMPAPLFNLVVELEPTA